MDNVVTDGAKTWKSVTALASLIALCALGWGYAQSQKVDQLSSALSESDVKMQQLVSDANARIQELAKRDLPISVSFRPALLGSGLVATFKNNSGQALEFAAEFSSSATNQERRTNLVIPANGVHEMGYTEGWSFAAGQHVRLSNTNFRTIEYTVPN